VRFYLKKDALDIVDDQFPCLKFEDAFEDGEALILRRPLLQHLLQVTTSLEQMDARLPESQRLIDDKRTNKMVWASPAQFSARYKKLNPQSNFEPMDHSGIKPTWESKSGRDPMSYTLVLTRPGLMEEADGPDVDELIGASPPSAVPAGPTSAAAATARPQRPGPMTLALTDGEVHMRPGLAQALEDQYSESSDSNSDSRMRQSERLDDRNRDY
jgi:hypothetical protein